MSFDLKISAEIGRRRFSRYAFQHDCKLIMDDLSLTGRLFDISLGGAGLSLPMVASSYGKLNELKFRIEDVCNFNAVVRWKVDKKIGLQFDPVAHRSTALRDLLESLSMRDQAESREITTVTSGFLPISS
ncbi:PilZ domain-containing protein [Pseudooceanicola sediminis]|uniref:PilZ domain-containing protein n=1 Tax=Pseudooceanicola sediminis TaxID=2211117 RepID=A0A399J1C8_9RHOB|nr:PilZ domain-containing protein [Pseudooceanicola sediminis]KAA2316159.1 PilZ domain-containing protein [Puniceibacterium sp. HSS470]RII39074.1 PilZ domain-containing protein [Pseudooceanicola sediminis]